MPKSHAAQVIDLLVRHGALTRPQMCRLSGAAPSAVHQAVTALARCGTIERLEAGEKSGGRRAHVYRLRADAGVTAGVHIGLRRIELGLFDLRGAQIAARTLDVAPQDTGPESCCVALCAALRQALGARDGGALLGVGVAIEAQARPQDGGVALFLGAPMWQDYPLAQRLAQMLDAPVRVQRAAPAQMDALLLRGMAQMEGCAVYLNLGERIEAAVMQDGRTLLGGHGLSGELGHITVRRDGAACICGNAGCLQLYGSQEGIVRQYNAASGGACRRVEEVMDRLRADDPAALKAVTQAVVYLVDALALLVLAYDPDTLLIDCPWLHGQEALRGQMLDVLHAKSAFTRPHLTQIRFLEESVPPTQAASAQVMLRLTQTDARILARLTGEA